MERHTEPPSRAATLGNGASSKPQLQLQTARIASASPVSCIFNWTGVSGVLHLLQTTLKCVNIENSRKRRDRDNYTRPKHQPSQCVRGATGAMHRTPSPVDTMGNGASSPRHTPAMLQKKAPAPLRLVFRVAIFTALTVYPRSQSARLNVTDKQNATLQAPFRPTLLDWCLGAAHPSAPVAQATGLALRVALSIAIA